MLFPWTRHPHLPVVFLLLLLPSLSLPCMAARKTPEFTTMPLTKTTFNNFYYYNEWHNVYKFLNLGRGSHVSGISELKRYLHRFGYLSSLQYNLSNKDVFDAEFESALIHYQTQLGLPISGKLDFNTLSQFLVPRCGFPDGDVLHAKSINKYVYFQGKPRWVRNIPMKLTYAFSPANVIITYLTQSEIKRVFKRAFSKWASVIPVSFVETDEYSYADIKIGFYSGDHGDGEPFDGVLGVLAHSFSPESGRLHLDAAETWAVDFTEEKSPVAVDLESVAVHEIGHLLGLSHSTIKEAVMFPTLKPRNKKVDLAVDDIKGVQSLYGSNPNFTFTALLLSDTSENGAVRSRAGWIRWVSDFLVFLVLFRHVNNV